MKVQRGVGEMAHWLKALDDKPDDLCSVPGPTSHGGQRELAPATNK